MHKGEGGREIRQNKSEVGSIRTNLNSLLYIIGYKLYSYMFSLDVLSSYFHWINYPQLFILALRLLYFQYHISQVALRAPRVTVTSACPRPLIRRHRQQRFGHESTFYANMPLDLNYDYRC